MRSVRTAQLIASVAFVLAIHGACRTHSELPERSPSLSALRADLSRRLIADGYTSADVLLDPPFLYVGLQGSDFEDIRILNGYPIGGLDMRGSSVRDLSGLRALSTLHWLLLSDTTPEDLSPLAGLSLDRLDLINCGLSNIQFLVAVDVRELYLSHNSIADISPLKGKQITILALDNTRVNDLSSLAYMPLEELFLNNTLVSDLSPLAGLPIRTLFIHETHVTDLTHLMSMPLEILTFDPVTVSNGIAKLRQVLTLESINETDPKVFWKAYDAGRPISP